MTDEVIETVVETPAATPEVQPEVAPEVTPTPEASAVPGAEAEVTPTPEPEATHDEKGVSYFNRAKEKERKLAASERKVEAMRLENERLSQLVPSAGSEDESYEVTEQRKIQEQVTAGVNTALRAERLATETARATISAMEEEIPDVGKYRAEIESQLSPLSKELRSSEYAVRNLVRQVLGSHYGELGQSKGTKAPTKPAPAVTPAANRTLVTPPAQAGSAVSKPTPSPTPAQIALTPEELATEDEYNLYDRGYDNPEIREFHAKRKKQAEIEAAAGQK